MIFFISANVNIKAIHPKPLYYRHLDDDFFDTSRQDAEIMPFSWQLFSVSCISFSSFSEPVFVKSLIPAMPRKDENATWQDGFNGQIASFRIACISYKTNY